MNVTAIYLTNVKTRKNHIFYHEIIGTEQCEEVLRAQELPPGIYIIGDDDKNYGILTVESKEPEFVVGEEVNGEFVNAMSLDFGIRNLGDVRVNKEFEISVHNSKMVEFLNFAHTHGFLDKLEVYFQRWNKVEFNTPSPTMTFQWF